MPSTNSPSIRQREAPSVLIRELIREGLAKEFGRSSYFEINDEPRIRLLFVSPTGIGFTITVERTKHAALDNQPEKAQER